MIKILVPSLVLALTAGCFLVTSGTVPAPPLGDAGAGVASHLTAIGCEQPSTFANTVNVNCGRTIVCPTDCWDDAGTAAQAAACGGLICPDSGK